MRRRLERLEEARQGRHTPDTEDLEERRAALRESMRRGRKRAEQEAAAGIRGGCTPSRTSRGTCEGA
ncbi:MAG: hypothetical protein M3M97_00625 [Actinomycetota bacterium]|nr:hypothetical protein [Actinomycetota bacterium]